MPTAKQFSKNLWLTSGRLHSYLLTVLVCQQIVPRVLNWHFLWNNILQIMMGFFPPWFCVIWCRFDPNDNLKSQICVGLFGLDCVSFWMKTVLLVSLVLFSWWLYVHVILTYISQSLMLSSAWCLGGGGVRSVSLYTFVCFSCFPALGSEMNECS